MAPWRLTVVVDNHAQSLGLLAEHGFSVWLERLDGDRPWSLLLDTGQRWLVLDHNLTALGLRDRRPDCLVLSHGHYDHSGGLTAYLATLPAPVPGLATHPRCWGPRGVTATPGREVGTGLSPQTLTDLGCPVDADAKPRQLTPGLWLSGSIPRREPLEVPQGFARGESATEPDLVDDDQCLILDQGAQGLVVITGCCHAGVVNTLEHAREVTGNPKLRGLVGGLHLHDVDPRRLDRTRDYLVALAPEFVLPLHCTGQAAAAHLAQGLGPALRWGGTGTALEMDD